MSQENMEVVRKHIDAFVRDEQQALSYLDPSVVIDSSRVGAPGRPDLSYGHAEVAQFARRYIGAFEEYAYEVERLTDLGSGAVLAVVTESGRGKSSGAPVRRSYATLYTVIDRKIARITVFPSEALALEAAGPGE